MTVSKSILAIIVLYRLSADESPAYTSLHALLARNEEAATAIDVLLFDNSPNAQEPPVNFSGRYVSDTSNPGLAAAYNHALRIAADESIPWLLLLDQDTYLHEAYLEELLLAVRQLDTQSEVAALVPKLADAGVLCSPAYPPGFRAARSIPADWCGITDDKLYAFNSGTAMNVAVLQRIGGFPLEFPLDYLDHATFAALRKSGGKLQVLKAVLPHELSSNHEAPRNSAAAIRQERVLEAERRFYTRYGTTGDRIMRRCRLLRAVAGRLIRRKEGGQTWRMLKSALWP